MSAAFESAVSNDAYSSAEKKENIFYAMKIAKK